MLCIFGDGELRILQWSKSLCQTTWVCAHVVVEEKVQRGIYILVGELVSIREWVPTPDPAEHLLFCVLSIRCYIFLFYVFSYVNGVVGDDSRAICKSGSTLKLKIWIFTYFQCWSLVSIRNRSLGNLLRNKYTARFGLLNECVAPLSTFVDAPLSMLVDTGDIHLFMSTSLANSRHKGTYIDSRVKVCSLKYLHKIVIDVIQGKPASVYLGLLKGAPHLAQSM